MEIKKQYIIDKSNPYCDILCMYENGIAVGGYQMPKDLLKEQENSSILEDLKNRGYKLISCKAKK